MPGTPITFRANVSDNEDGEIPDYAIKWAADGADIGGGRLIADHATDRRELLQRHRSIERL